MLRQSMTLPGACVAILAFALPIAAQQAPITIARIAVIGCEDCSDSRHLGKVLDVAVNQQGNVLVADEEAPTLRVFSREGTPLQQFGRKGSGPGEYEFPMRIAFGQGGSVHVLDMRLRRITHVAADGSSPTAVPLGTFPGAVSARGESGELVVLSDDFHGTLTITRWLPNASAANSVTRLENPPTHDGVLHIPGIAVSREGEIAVARDATQYRITRVAPDGTIIGELSRDIPRLRRTAEEQAELDRRLKNVASRVAAEKARSTAPSPFPGGAGDLSLKPHFLFDGMRYDERGNLWVLTMRGTTTRAVIDVFSRDGKYLGALEIPSNVNGYALGGSYLVTTGARDDDTPMVELWRVTPR